MDKILFTRQQLYDLVWSDSLLTLSKKYQISDVGLRKMCIRLAIPLPAAGHWAKVQAGKIEIIRPPLPVNNKVEQQIGLELRPVDRIAKEQSAQLSIETELENDPLLDLVVKEELHNPDPLVARALKSLTKKDKYYREGGLIYTDFEELDIKVTPGLVNRALCIMDTFIKAMRERGYNFETRGRESYVLLKSDKMKMTLREVLKRVVIEEGTYQRTDYQPTGKLFFKFDRFSTWAECRDGKLPVETQLAKIISKLEVIDERFRLEEIENEKRREAAREKQRIAEEYEKRRKLELNSLKQVLKDSARWKETLQLREYIDFVEEKAIASGNLTSELIAWLDWARKKADWLDPLIGRSDEWLDGIDPNSLLKDEEDSIHNPSWGYNQTDFKEKRIAEKKSWPLLPWYVNKK